MMSRRSIILFLSLLLIPRALFSQEEISRQDTLSAAVKESYRFFRLSGGGYTIQEPALRSQVTPTGDPDVIKFTQFLPGVSSGADGSSAIYVRGGDVGNSRITLDGTPVYGSSHLLGVSQAIPLSVCSESEITLGGFSPSAGNFTAAHIAITTSREIPARLKSNVSGSLFMLGGDIFVPDSRGQLSFIGSLRGSPTGVVAPLFLRDNKFFAGTLDDASGTVYDAFGKINWRVNGKNHLSISSFYSSDSYFFAYRKAKGTFAWSNWISQLHHEGQWGHWTVHNALSWNQFQSDQTLRQDLSALNTFAVESSVKEASLTSSGTLGMSEKASLLLGFNAQTTSFLPGAKYNQESDDRPSISESAFSGKNRPSFLLTFFSQINSHLFRRISLHAGGRINYYRYLPGAPQEAESFFVPEFDLSASFALSPRLSMELTADYRSQFFHQLEGLPMGWSLDLMVPSCKDLPYETAVQWTAGLSYRAENLSLSAEIYNKEMKNLVYYRNAVNLFSPSLSGWKSDIATGSGTSRGIEFLAEYHWKELLLKVAYTYSNSSRLFPDLNGSEPFPSQFDRPHILNGSVSYLLLSKPEYSIRLNSLFTYQSGHCETVSVGSFTPWLLREQGADPIEWYSGKNNYRMPAYIRMDFGCTVSWEKNHHPMSLNAGIYNLLNRHNPVSLVYDAEEMCWKQIYIFPMFPSVRFTAQF